MTPNAQATSRSAELFHKAQQYIPGGVNSPVRAYRAVGGTPPFIQSAEGARLKDVDGNEYIDYVGSWGPMILGHNHPAVLEAVQNTITRGLSFGAPCELEVTMAETLCRLMPSLDKVRMVNSGTEATMSAIRLARGVTGRDKIIKFEGCYHGHADALLVKAGSGALTFGSPSSPGVPQHATHDTLVATFNDLDSAAKLFEKNPHDIAAIILEPIAGNMNMLLPQPEFLKGLRALCDQYGSLLICDEVMTGFRVALGGAQSLYDLSPDITTLGKIIGGGMPVGAFGGRADIMDHLSPVGSVYQAGTLSGNPVAMAAGLAVLNRLQEPSFYDNLKTRTQSLVDGLSARANAADISLRTHYAAGMFGLFFTEKECITSYDDVLSCDAERFKLFFHGLLHEGIYLAPSAFEAGFISSAHSIDDIATTLDAAEKVFSQIVS